MTPNGVLEGVELVLRRQLAVQQQVANLHEAGVLGELLNRVAPVHEDAFLAIDEGDVRLAAAGRHETRVIGEYALFPVQAGNVDNVWPGVPLRTGSSDSEPSGLFKT